MGENESGRFKIKAEQLFSRLSNMITDNTQKQIVEQKQSLKAMIDTQKNIDQAQSYKKQFYNRIHQKAMQLSSQIDIQYSVSQKSLIRLQNKIESSNRNMESLFSKLRKEREANQNQLNQFVDHYLYEIVEKKHKLLQNGKKNQNDFSGERAVKQIKKIQKEISFFFVQAQKQENQLKSQIFSAFRQYRDYLKGEDGEQYYQECQNLLQTVRYETIFKINQMKLKREHMEEQVLTLLQNIFVSLSTSKNK